jgi:ABC-2 type transport system permease protein
VIGDLVTVLWKEWRSLTSGRARRQLALTGGLMLFYAFLFPIQMGRDWVSDPIPVGILTIVLPTIIVGLIVPDAIAGERERRTLPTLLATRLPDRAILYGKLGFGVGLGWLGVPIMLAISLLAVNVTAATDGPLMYDAALVFGALALALLIGTLTGGIAIFVSLRARTAQEAQQLTVVGLMLPLMVVGMGLTVAITNEGFRHNLIDLLGGIDMLGIALAVMALIAVADVAVIAAADRRFRRGRLISG